MKTYAFITNLFLNLTFIVILEIPILAQNSQEKTATIPEQKAVSEQKTENIPFAHKLLDFFFVSIYEKNPKGATDIAQKKTAIPEQQLAGQKTENAPFTHKVLDFFFVPIHENTPTSDKDARQKKMAMEPLEFKKIYEETAQAKKESESLQRQVTNVATLVSEKDTEIDQLKYQLDSLRTAKMEEVAAKLKTPPTDTYDKGLVFKVQVGDVKMSKLNRAVFKKDTGDFVVEKDEDGQLKYTLACFRTAEEANEFKIKIKQIGIKTAWVIVYQDGKKLGGKHEH